MAETRADTDVVEEDDDFFELANLSPALTGLPMVVWISERGRSRHDVRVKVSLVPGRRLDPGRMCSVSVRPDVDVVAGGPLATVDLDLVRRWIDLNKDTIVDYWNGKLLTDEAIARLRPLAP
jgi:hypothetical protein